MSIEATLQEEMKTAMKAKDADKVACVRQVRAKVQEASNAEGFTGAIDDALYQKVITSYVRSLEKGIVELQAGGDRSQPLRDKYQAEIDYLKSYLPQMLGEAETQKLVQETIAKMSATAKQGGQVMGSIMKDYKGKVDPALLKKLVDAAFQP